MPAPLADALYIYYRVDPAQEALARQRVEALLRDVEARTGVRGRRLCKQGEPSLWMEVYDPVPDPGALQKTLREAESRLEIHTVLLPGSTRKTEHFRPCA